MYLITLRNSNLLFFNQKDTEKSIYNLTVDKPSKVVT